MPQACARADLHGVGGKKRQRTPLQQVPTAQVVNFNSVSTRISYALIRAFDTHRKLRHTDRRAIVSSAQIENSLHSLDFSLQQS